MMKLTCSDGFVSELSTETVDNVTFVTITAKAKEKAEILNLNEGYAIEESIDKCVPNTLIVENGRADCADI